MYATELSRGKNLKTHTSSVKWWFEPYQQGREEALPYLEVPDVRQFPEEATV